MDVEDDLPALMGKPGCRYGDLPKLTEEYFYKFINIVGKDNLQWITLAEYINSDNQILKRGQYLISPEGLERIKEWMSTQL